jgi:hypothetical protein
LPGPVAVRISSLLLPGIALLARRAISDRLGGTE